MTPYQIGAIAILAGVLLWNYLPAFSFRLPSLPKKPDHLKQIEQVLAIKDSSANPKVQEACQALLQALIS